MFLGPGAASSVNRQHVYCYTRYTGLSLSARTEVCSIFRSGVNCDRHGVNRCLAPRGGQQCAHPRSGARQKNERDVSFTIKHCASGLRLSGGSPRTTAVHGRARGGFSHSFSLYILYWIRFSKHLTKTHPPRLTRFRSPKKEGEHQNVLSSDIAMPAFSKLLPNKKPTPHD